MIFASAINPYYDPYIIQLIKELTTMLPTTMFGSVASSIASVFTVIFFGVRAYQMLLLEGKLNIMPLFRPFLIAIVLVNFSLFTQVLSIPADTLESQYLPNFITHVNDIDKISTTRDSLTNKLMDVFQEKLAAFYATKINNKENEQDEELNNDSYAESADNYNNNGNIETVIDDQMSGSMDEQDPDLKGVNVQMATYDQIKWSRTTVYIQNKMTQFILALVKGAGYLVFFLQGLMLLFLTILGPLAFAFSITGFFKDTWITWTTQYVSVTFYKVIAYIVMNMGMALLEYGMLKEITRLNILLSQDLTSPTFIVALNHSDDFLFYFFTTCLVYLFGFKSIPTIIKWFLSSSGGADAIKGRREIANAGRTARDLGRTAKNSYDKSEKEYTKRKEIKKATRLLHSYEAIKHSTTAGHVAIRKNLELYIINNYNQHYATAARLLRNKKGKKLDFNDILLNILNKNFNNKIPVQVLKSTPAYKVNRIDGEVTKMTLYAHYKNRERSRKIVDKVARRTKTIGIVSLKASIKIQQAIHHRFSNNSNTEQFSDGTENKFYNNEDTE